MTESCLSCGIDTPVTLILMDPERYEEGLRIPDNRIYRLVCLVCGLEITKYVTDNTISAIKQLRDKLDSNYGKSIVWR